MMTAAVLLMGTVFLPMQVQAEEDPASEAGTAAAIAGHVQTRAQTRAQAAHPGITVIVLDPGHGGTIEEDLGAQYAPYSEKNMTLLVAAYMYQELAQYDNVAVYMTRTTDTPVSLRQRVDFAAAVNADFLFSIHFNAREYHDQFGSEVEISAFGDAYQSGATFAQLELAQLQGLGLYPRGARVKLSHSGKSDYYGIIRRAAAAGIPAVIAEHCYLDHEPDRTFLSAPDALAKLAHADVTALAQYLHLKSTALGVDYTNFTYPEAPMPKDVMAEDVTPPELDAIQNAVYQETTGQAVVNFLAEDSDSPIVYCNYSLDGGATWSEIYPVNRAGKEQAITIPAKRGDTVMIRVHNLYNYYTTSAPFVVQ
ncbi:N-acetylmuramoyl-L-alanine amidase [Lachnospiraceae bacterium NK3A20]|nr:N-acetylmuramoyl-L-alanine amidase [Lachnospiraceae bacterium NK3A20]